MSIANTTGPANAMARLNLQHPEGPEYTRPLGFRQNPAVRKEIESLDPVKDCQRIAYLMVAYEFPHEIESGLNVVYYGSGGQKALADILGRSDFSQAGVKRYEDTKFIIWKFMESGWDIDEGHRAIMHMNNIHGHYKIKNDQFGISLCVFTLAPLRWIENFGWRKMTENERLGWFNFWMQIGALMNIEKLPADEDEAQAWLEDYFNNQNELSEFGPMIGEAMGDTFYELAPWYKKPFIRRYYRTFLTPAVCKAYGMKNIPLIGKLPMILMLKLSALKRKFYSTHMYPYAIDRDTSYQTYPNGMPVVEDAGPTYIVNRMKAKKAEAQAAQ